MQSLISSFNLPDADCRQAERMRATIDVVKTGDQSAVYRDQGNKNLLHVIDPTPNIKPLQEVWQAITTEEITTDVHNAIARAKEINATRRGWKIKIIPAKDHRLVTRYLGGAVIQLNHYQRPGVTTHMPQEEVLKARDIGDDIHLVSVKEHNTSTTTQATSPSQETRCR